MTQDTPWTRERLATLIEQGARTSIPWPDSPDYDWETDKEIPITLEQFVNHTHIRENGADVVFRAASLKAADNILAALASARGE